MNSSHEDISDQVPTENGQQQPTNGARNPPTSFPQQPFIRPPVLQQVPPSRADPYMQYLQQQQQGYVSELLRQQQEMMRQQQEAMKQQQLAFIQQQEQLMRSMMSSIQVQVPPNPEALLDSLANNIKEFRYDLDGQITFAAWYRRYEDLFEKDASRLEPAAKVRLLIRKLGIAEHDRTRLLTKIEERNDVTLEQISEECQRLLNLRHDAAMIEAPAASVKVLRSEPKVQWLWKVGSQTWILPERSENAKWRFEQRKGSVAAKVVTVNTCSVKERRKYVKVDLNGTVVRLQVDTGSDISIISSDTWCKIGKPGLCSSTVVAKTATGKPLDICGEFECTLVINGKSLPGLLRVTSENLHLLGTDVIEVFGLWSVPLDTVCGQVTSSISTVEGLKSEFPSVFTEQLGLCKKVQVKLELKAGKSPVFRPKRPVAYAVHEAVNDELDRLEREKIITPVDFSDWAAPIVVVRKANGSIRICGDYSTGLNDALQPHQYPLPLPQDIFTSLANCTVFSQIDLSDAFLQVEVEDGSKSLLTINTHRGLYRYNRLTPGVKAAPGAFQQIVDQMLTGLVHTSGYLDDVVVGGINDEDHRKNLRAVFQRFEEFGFTIRAEKCSFGKSQIRYLGHLLDRHGLRPDPAKIETILKLPAPADVSGVRSFLGALNYYGKFVPNMRTWRYPMDELLKEGVEFRWTTDCQRSFDRFKEILSSDLLLTHYDPTLEIIVSADASSVGVGATISHKFPDGKIKVVQHAARALTKAEQGYSQPDREGLAIIFAITKFHKMVFAGNFACKRIMLLFSASSALKRASQCTQQTVYSVGLSLYCCTIL
ncbi:uncharacterized protein LOC129741335 [Uranotaenia lowii]|uniref:uncharacterized protein LOC129741335 n=1 Tax=Uranotaenia lowii TaxID=190385 RepID=UPI00247A1101|nr:uncharacterized protein LOC129741335 [Uranotaenia lowii]